MIIGVITSSEEVKIESQQSEIFEGLFIVFILNKFFKLLFSFMS